MSDWIEPITDRTAADVKGLDSGSPEYQKGALNADDLNRIEGNYRYILEHLETDAIFIPHAYRNRQETTINPDGTATKTTYTDWREHNLPWLSEINRIRANYNALVRLFLVGLGLPVLAESNYLDWQEVNDWERIAAVGKTIFENMEQEYRRCGAYTCGEDGVDWAPYEKKPAYPSRIGSGVLGRMLIGYE